MICKEIFCEWPYDQALRWMSDAHHEVSLCQRRIFVGVGSHNEIAITMGRDPGRGSIDKERLKAWPQYLIRAIDRGGGVTAHEPGQIVIYPIINLRAWGIGMRDIIELLQSCAINFAESLGIDAHTRPESPGIYVGNAKTGFIGMRLKDGVSMHGLALNVLNDAQIFSAIEPCGIKGLKVSSLREHAQLLMPIAPYVELIGEQFVIKLQKLLYE